MATITRGNSAYWTIPILNSVGGPLNLTGCTVTVTYKASADDTDTAALFQHYLEISGAGSVTASKGMKLGPGGVSAGVVIERLSPKDSANFAKGDYIYDVQVVIPNPDDGTDPDVYTPIIGDKDTVILDITTTIDVTP